MKLTEVWGYLLNENAMHTFNNEKSSGISLARQTHHIRSPLKTEPSAAKKKTKKKQYINIF